jgi:hypothetical protein
MYSLYSPNVHFVRNNVKSERSGAGGGASREAGSSEARTKRKEGIYTEDTESTEVTERR